MRLRRVFVQTDVYVVFTVRDEVGYRKREIENYEEIGIQDWREYFLTVYQDEGNVRIIFEWIVREQMDERELYELLERLGVQWDEMEVDDEHYDDIEVYLYRGSELVAKIEKPR